LCDFTADCKFTFHTQQNAENLKKSCTTFAYHGADNECDNFTVELSWCSVPNFGVDAVTSKVINYALRLSDNGWVPGPSYGNWLHGCSV